MGGAKSPGNSFSARYILPISTTKNETNDPAKKKIEAKIRNELSFLFFEKFEVKSPNLTKNPFLSKSRPRKYLGLKLRTYLENNTEYLSRKR